MKGTEEEGRPHTTVIKETQIVKNETKYWADEKKMGTVGELIPALPSPELFVRLAMTAALLFSPI